MICLIDSRKVPVNVDGEKLVLGMTISTIVSVKVIKKLDNGKFFISEKPEKVFGKLISIGLKVSTILANGEVFQGVRNEDISIVG